MLNRRFIGSQLAFLSGTVVMLGGLGTLGDGLLIGPIMVLGAAAYSSRKRRRLGLEPETAGVKVFEGLCVGLIATMWLGSNDLRELIATDPRLVPDHPALGADRVSVRGLPNRGEAGGCRSREHTMECNAGGPLVDFCSDRFAHRRDDNGLHSRPDRRLRFRIRLRATLGR